MGRLKRYVYGWSDPRGMFGDAPVKGEGMPVRYDFTEEIEYTMEVEFEPEGETNESSESDDT